MSFTKSQFSSSDSQSASLSKSTSTDSKSSSSSTSKDISPRPSLHEEEYQITPEDYAEHNIQAIDFAPGSLVAQTSGDGVIVERKKSLVKRAGSLVWNKRAKYSRRGKLMELMG